jgi:hypothetical protein
VCVCLCVCVGVHSTAECIGRRGDVAVLEKGQVPRNTVLQFFISLVGTK